MASIQALFDGYENHFLMAAIDKLYLTSEIADVDFVFGNDENRERVPAHKSLLAAGSQVFKAMFYDDLNKKKDVEITEASPAAFKEFLQFFYRSKVNLTVENAFDVVNLCKRYDVATCQSICDRFLRDKLTITNDSVCSVYGLATLFDMDDLKKRCQSKIVHNTEAVFSSSSFLDCDRFMLSSILKLDELSCSEVSVFYACMNWVKAKAKQEEITREMVQAHLGDLFYEVRFGSMTLEELADLTPSYGDLFLFDEYKEIVQMIRFEDFQPKCFKRDHRQVHIPQWNADAVIKFDRIAAVNSYELLFKTSEKTTFTSNKPILVGEVWCMPVIRGHSIAEMTISEISHDGANKTIYSDNNVIFSDSRYVNVRLAKPILIKPNLMYDFQFKLSSKQQVKYVACSLKNKVEIPGTDIVIEFVGENKNGGIVKGLYLNPISKV